MSAVMQPQLKIRPMEASDLSMVLEIEQAAHLAPWTEGIFQDCLRVGYHCNVLLLDNEVIGYTVVSMVAGESHIFNICINPEFQGQGYGRRLMRQVIDSSRRVGMESLFLEVRPSNKVAIALYESLGFCEVGMRKQYYPAPGGREDALIMAMAL